eukprot:2139337-Alexandrium_andersonii.AAC.1
MDTTPREHQTHSTQVITSMIASCSACLCAAQPWRAADGARLERPILALQQGSVLDRGSGCALELK